MNVKQLVFWSLCLALGAAAFETARGQQNPGVHVAWGKPTDGLKIGISFNEATSSHTRLPHIQLWLANAGKEDIKGVIQSAARCVVFFNGEFYALEDNGGKTSAMPPGRQYGPVEIDLREFHKIKQLQPPSTIPVEELRSGLLPKLSPGRNTICVYFSFGFDSPRFAQSGELEVFNSK
jgi:hypothetical protein